MPLRSLSAFVVFFNIISDTIISPSILRGKFKCRGTYCGNEVFFTLNFLLFSSCGLCDTETFCTPGDLLVYNGSLCRLIALTTLVIKIIRNRKQHCSYSRSVHLRGTSHQLWCETRRAGHNLKLSVVSLYGGTQREHTPLKANQTNPKSNGEMDKLTIDSHRLFCDCGHYQ